MLLSLEIRNIVLIEALTLDFQPGLNVLTGETGAGKSILLDALGFALGRQGGRDLVGAAGDQATVTAVFAVEPDHPAAGIMADLGLDAGEGELVLRRIAAKDGPARGFVNDQRTSAEALRQIGGTLVEVHGQHDDRGLLNPRGHRALLDALGGHERKLAETRANWEAAQAAAKRLTEAEDTLTRAAGDADFLRHSVAELEKLAPEPGEDDALDAERRLIKAAARIRDEIGQAAQALSPEAAEGMLGDALSRLGHAADKADGLLDAPVEAIDRALVALGEAQRGVEDALDRLSFDPGRLDEVEERLFAIRGLARKHNVAPDDLPKLAEDFADRMQEIDLGDARIADLKTEAGAAREAYSKAAGALTKAREAAVAKLDKRVTKELAPLKMENAAFETRIAPGREGPEGVDDVAFTASINPGTPAGPIDRIASGGELSRFLLALKVCLAARAPGLTMIFDEIDRGIGGATADAVGRRLAGLAGTAQVLVVTHSPQVAARGAHHWRIAKTSDGRLTRTDVDALDPDLRVDEIARMLAGETVTPEARSAARALMEGAA
ncbi:MAG: DNA repair protein RecN [Paracoccaceae bacterium]|nr:DNA repair protein RecN [Paracoccaceae bacterium]